jgi:hypothetical protein
MYYLYMWTYSSQYFFKFKNILLIQKNSECFS